MTMVRFALVGFVMMTGIAYWQEAVPIPRTGNSCPWGYGVSGAYCVPRQGRGTPYAIPKTGNSCPWGWIASRGACLQASDGRQKR
jgi:hypothetical protein